MELFATKAAEPTGIGTLTVFEELFLGVTRASRCRSWHPVAAASLPPTHTRKQLGEWLRRCSAHQRTRCSIVLFIRPGAASDVGASSPARYDEANDEWVLTGVKTGPPRGIANVHIVVRVHPELGSRGQATFIIPPNTPGLKQGKKFRSMESRGFVHRRVTPTTSGCPPPDLGGKEQVRRAVARNPRRPKPAGQAR